MDPDLLPGSGGEIIVPDLDPQKNQRADFISHFASCEFWTPCTVGRVGLKYEIENDR